MAFRDTIWLGHACGHHCRSLHGTRLSAQGSSKCIQIDGRYHRRCSFGTSAYDRSTNFDFKNVSFESHVYATRPAHANSECSSNAFDHA